jgi:predicted amidohydrolase YtcJ
VLFICEIRSAREEGRMAGLVFRGGAVFDGFRYHPDATVTVRDGRIAAGDDAATGSETVDLAGGLLLPGFTDAHIHPIQGGLERMRCDLSGSAGRAAYLEVIAAYARERPGAEWILGGGWHQSDFPGGTPTAAEVDPVAPDRPLFLLNADHHGAWVNTRALALAGIDARTPDPADGRIERSPDGTPTGTLHEGAMDLVGRFVPETTHDELVAALLEAQAYLRSLGITGWQDAILGAYANLPDAAAAYLDVAGSGRLTARVNAALWWRRDRGTEQVAELAERRKALRAGRFRADAVKIMQDGVAENFTAGLLAPYLDASGNETSNSGLSFLEPAVLNKAVTELDAAGFQVHVHAIGDRAVRETLDAFAAARAENGASGNRHHVAHLQVMDDADVGRFAELGVTANLQPLWAAYERQQLDLTIPFLGPERSARQYRFGDLRRYGARLAAGSDWPVSSPDPLAGIHVAVNRRLPPDLADFEIDAEYGAFLPEQALDLTAAFAAYTSGSAWVNHADQTGRIAPGALADLVVLDRDPFAEPPEAVSSARVLATYIEGIRIH